MFDREETMIPVCDRQEMLDIPTDVDSFSRTGNVQENIKLHLEYDSGSLK